MEAYEIALTRTSTDAAPWYVVPADHKWYARLAVQNLLLDALRGLNLEWPKADYDVAAEQKRLAASLGERLDDRPELQPRLGELALGVRVGDDAGAGERGDRRRRRAPRRARSATAHLPSPSASTQPTGPP